MRLILGPLVIVFVFLTLGCGGDGVVPPTGPVSTALATVQITGNVDLTGLGQTSQLAATGHYSDGSTKDVTPQTTWTVNPSGVMTVSSDGRLTAVSLGMATVSATVGGLKTSAIATVAPAGTFILTGRVREPGGGSLTSVRVVEQVSFTDTMTDQFGDFRFFAPSSARIRIELPDFELFERDVTQPATSRYVSLDAPMQRTVRINAGLSRGDLRIAPNDVSYTVGTDLCNPCKLIRVISGGPATLTLRLAWTGGAGVLKLWANGARNSTAGSNMVVNVPTTGGQTLVYVGWTQPAGQGAPGYVNFSFSVD